MYWWILASWFALGLNCVLLVFLGCSLPRGVKSRVRSDLEFAHSIHGIDATPLHRGIFGDGPLNGDRYVSFFEKRVTRIEGEGILFASCKGALACHAGGTEIRLSKNYARLGLPQVVRLSYLLHEARHSEGWPHVKCPPGVHAPFTGVSLEGKKACDSSSLGAYGIQIVMLRNIEKFCGSCEKSVRQESGRFADALMDLIVSQSARHALVEDSR